MQSALAGLVIGGAVVASCTFNPGPAGSAQSTGANPGQGTGTTGVFTGGAGVGGTGTAGSGNTGTPTPDGSNCGLQQYGLQNVPPDLLIILDKSGSMAQQADGTNCPMGGGACMPKWPAMVDAINMVVGTTQAQIRWGLKYFPAAAGGRRGGGGGGCAVANGADVAIAPNNGMAISTSLGMTMPNGSTPTRTAVASGATYLMGLTDPNPKYILLATDGLPNCIPNGADAQASDAMGAVAAVTAAAAAGIPVFVVGIGSVPDGIAALNAMAVAGGRPRAGDPMYYPVNTTADLVSVLTTIGGQIASCTFNLGKAPPDPNNIGVYANGMTSMKIPRDPTHANGWDYGTGMTSIELYGAACDNVKNKVTMTVEAIFGCPGMVVP